jgi:hypothetical protein
LKLFENRVPVPGIRQSGRAVSAIMLLELTYQYGTVRPFSDWSIVGIVLLYKMILYRHLVLPSLKVLIHTKEVIKKS